MKKITGLVVVLAALVLGGYFGMGVVTERTLKHNVEVVNQSNGLAVDIKQYQRHWFGSEADVDLRVHVAERIVDNPEGKPTTIAAQDYTMNIPVTIYHGPVIYTGSGVLFGLGYAQGHLSLPKELTEQFATYFEEQSTKPEINLSVFVNYLNKSRVEIGVPAFKLISKEGKGEANWLGMTGNISISSNMNKIDGNFTLEGLNVEKDKMNGTLGQVTSDYVLHKTTEGLYIGEATVSLPSFVVAQDGHDLFVLNQFKVHSESTVEAGLFNTNLNASLDKVLSNGKTYGPGEIEMSIKNLDASVLAALKVQANKMNNSVGAERRQAMFAMLPELPKLLSKGPIFEITTLKCTVPEGEINSHFTVGLPKGDIGNPFLLVQKIEGEGKFQVPAAIVKRILIESLKQKATAQTSVHGAITSQSQHDETASESKKDEVQPSVASEDVVTQQATAEADKKITALIQAKVISEQGQDYVLEFRLSQGQLVVNGQPFNPAALNF